VRRDAALVIVLGIILILVGCALVYWGGPGAAGRPGGYEPFIRFAGIALVVIGLILVVVGALGGVDLHGGNRDFLVGGPTVVLTRLAEWRRRTRARRATIISLL
jgi:hypothetical protein